MADNAVTGKLVRTHSDGTFNYKAVVNYGDVNGAGADGDTVTVTLGNTPTEFVVLRAATYDVGWATATGTLTGMLGFDGDPDNLIDAQSVLTDGPKIGAAGAVPVTEAGSVASASDSLVYRLTTAGGGDPQDITAGKTVILLQIEDVANAAIGF